ncbi:hypothetical protein GA0115240_122310 [Streptomyces sp. DvalAA-14]|uniref:hypothetical protein n=1 Tax=unclassified Streptomyces TaxID=2593676 RepID=UPI00081BC676|nr:MULTISPECIES: hypothetical protein [unclassified Streptomyces]SCD74899.1 hypothetical protein GA0115240_122310 [Streptomyces sp. DvalAA-14]
MSDPIPDWTDRMRDLTEDLNPETCDRFVRDLYEAAQNDLDEQRAKADFDREE